MKNIKIFLIVIMVITISSCSKSDNASNSSCNEIVCGGTSGAGTYTIYRGTLNPDTCGQIELKVNATTFNYYKAKWDANPEGHCCWEGIK